MLRLIFCLFFFLNILEGAFIPYIIGRPSPGAGFWSNFSVVLHGLDKADKKGWIPVIDMEQHPTQYNETYLLFNTMNAWEYYFEQPGGVFLGKALKRKHFNDYSGKAYSWALTVQPPIDRLVRARQLIAKYIRIKRSILDEVDDLICPGNHETILGVHVRGTDRRQGICEGHALTAEVQVYLEAALELDRIHDFAQIFLACDEIESVDLFRQAFGERLMFIDAYRVSAETETKKDYDWLFKASRVNHRYLLGREVLMDALLLSRCGHLLCGPSNVSHAAIYFASEKQIVHEVASPGMTDS